MFLEAEQEGALVADVNCADSTGGPHDSYLVAIGIDNGASRHIPIVFNVHPFGHGIHGHVADANDIWSGDDTGGGNDGHLYGGRLITNAIAV